MTQNFVDGVAVADLVGQRASTRNRGRAKSAMPRDIRQESCGATQPKKDRRLRHRFRNGTRAV